MIVKRVLLISLHCFGILLPISTFAVPSEKEVVSEAPSELASEAPRSASPISRRHILAACGGAFVLAANMETQVTKGAWTVAQLARRAGSSSHVISSGTATVPVRDLLLRAFDFFVAEGADLAEVEWHFPEAERPGILKALHAYVRSGQRTIWTVQLDAAESSSRGAVSIPLRRDFEEVLIQFLMNGVKEGVIRPASQSPLPMAADARVRRFLNGKLDWKNLSEGTEGWARRTWKNLLQSKKEQAFVDRTLARALDLYTEADSEGNPWLILPVERNRLLAALENYIQSGRKQNWELWYDFDSQSAKAPLKPEFEANLIRWLIEGIERGVLFPANVDASEWVEDEDVYAFLHGAISKYEFSARRRAKENERIRSLEARLHSLSSSASPQGE